MQMIFIPFYHGDPSERVSLLHSAFGEHPDYQLGGDVAPNVFVFKPQGGLSAGQYYEASIKAFLKERDLLPDRYTMVIPEFVHFK